MDRGRLYLAVPMSQLRFECRRAAIVLGTPNDRDDRFDRDARVQSPFNRCGIAVGIRDWSLSSWYGGFVVRKAKATTETATGEGLVG